ncbi:hypothetical protein M8818_006084 [Zalaria obscura]|uniref:Uncharacterized protein n=1 Tax=Zalaria obscura TaxID=2024903 RepID=A0ACC3S6W3_9PEZI
MDRRGAKWDDGDLLKRGDKAVGVMESDGTSVCLAAAPLQGSAHLFTHRIAALLAYGEASNGQDGGMSLFWKRTYSMCFTADQTSCLAMMEGLADHSPKGPLMTMRSQMRSQTTALSRHQTHAAN